MFISRIALVALSVFGLVQAIPAPISKNVAISRTTNDTGVDGTDSIMAVLTTLKGQTDTILPQIDTFVASGKRTDENVDPLFDELIAALTAAQESLTGIDAQGIASTDNLNEVGAVIADTIKGISATLDASSVSLSLIGTIALLLFNLLIALNALLPGILVVIFALLSGIVGIVITLLLTLLSILIL